MTYQQYHKKFFPADTKWNQLGLRTQACERQDSVFECPKKLLDSSLEELEMAEIKYDASCPSYYVLLGRGCRGAWNELAICNNKDLLTIWRDVHYGSLIAKF